MRTSIIFLLALLIAVVFSVKTNQWPPVRTQLKSYIHLLTLPSMTQQTCVDPDGLCDRGCHQKNAANDGTCP